MDFGTWYHTKFAGKPLNEYGGRPPMSPDLCVIELVFNIWSQKISQHKNFTISQLKSNATKEWKKLDQVSIQNCFRRMLRVYPWVLQNNGEEYCE